MAAHDGSGSNGFADDLKQFAPPHAPKLLPSKELACVPMAEDARGGGGGGGGGWLDEAMWNRIAGRLRLGTKGRTKGRPRNGTEAANDDHALAKEWAALRWLCDRGCTDEELAILMNLSVHTVRQYLRRVTARLDCPNRTAAVAKVFRTYVEIVQSERSP